MATSKVSTKKTTSKTSRTAKRDKQSKLFLSAVVVIVLLSVIVLGSWAIRSVINANNQARLDRIQSIYSSLDLNQDQYRVTSSEVFGDKRTYEWDKDRSQSSWVEYVHGDTVTNTLNQLDEKIRAAGFEFIDEPYPGISEKQYHYKSDKGEYIRLKVASKPYEDASFNASIMNQSAPDPTDQDKSLLDQAPALVTIKVNLDNNNE